VIADNDRNGGYASGGVKINGPGSIRNQVQGEWHCPTFHRELTPNTIN
jgi:hypothetical protein